MILETLIKEFAPALRNIIGDKTAADQAAHELAVLALKADERSKELESLERQAQVKVNEAAAASADPYTSRARPTCIYVMLFLFAIGYIVPVVLGIYCQLTGTDYSYQAPDVEFAWATLTGLLGFGGLRGVDKYRQSKAEAGTL